MSKIIGKNLFYLREQVLKLSQDDFAEKLGVSQMTVSKWESEERNPKDIEPILKLHYTITGKTLNKNWLMKDEGEMLLTTTKKTNVISSLAEYWKKKYLEALEEIEEVRRENDELKNRQI